MGSKGERGKGQMFELRPSERNLLPVEVVTGGKVVSFKVWYATAKTSQKVAFESERTQFKRGKMQFNSVNPAIRFGLELITEVEDGVLTIDGKPISTNPSNPNYNPDWKKVLGELAIINAELAGVLIAVATAAFDNVRIVGAEQDVDDKGETDTPPLGQN